MPEEDTAASSPKSQNTKSENASDSDQSQDEPCFCAPFCCEACKPLCGSYVISILLLCSSVIFTAVPWGYVSFSADSLREFEGYSNTEIGFLIPFFGAANMVMTVMVGNFGQHFHPKLLIIGAVALMGGSAAIIAFIPAYVALLGGFMLFGAGYAVFRVIPYDQVIALIKNPFAQRVWRQGFEISAQTLGPSGGRLLMMLSTSLIVGRFGWRLPWIVTAVACGANCALIFVFADYAPQASSADVAKAQGHGAEHTAEEERKQLEMAAKQAGKDDPDVRGPHKSDKGGSGSGSASGSASGSGIGSVGSNEQDKDKDKDKDKESEGRKVDGHGGAASSDSGDDDHYDDDDKDLTHETQEQLQLRALKADNLTYLEMAKLFYCNPTAVVLLAGCTSIAYFSNGSSVWAPSIAKNLFYNETVTAYLDEGNSLQQAEQLADTEIKGSISAAAMMAFPLGVGLGTAALILVSGVIPAMRVSWAFVAVAVVPAVFYATADSFIQFVLSFAFALAFANFPLLFLKSIPTYLRFPRALVKFAISRYSAFYSVMGDVIAQFTLGILLDNAGARTTLLVLFSALCVAFALWSVPFVWSFLAESPVSIIYTMELRKLQDRRAKLRRALESVRLRTKKRAHLLGIIHHMHPHPAANQTDREAQEKDEHMVRVARERMQLHRSRGKLDELAEKRREIAEKERAKRSADCCGGCCHDELHEEDPEDSESIGLTERFGFCKWCELSVDGNSILPSVREQVQAIEHDEEHVGVGQHCVRASDVLRDSIGGGESGSGNGNGRVSGPAAAVPRGGQRGSGETSGAAASTEHPGRTKSGVASAV